MRYSDEQLARICCEANRALQNALGEAHPSEPWDTADSDRRASYLAGIATTRLKATPKNLHDAWKAEKAAAGWRYGPVKDEQARTHPCLLAYEDLPPGQQDKNRLFLAIVTALDATEAAHV